MVGSQDIRLSEGIPRVQVIGILTKISYLNLFDIDLRISYSRKTCMDTSGKTCMDTSGIYLAASLGGSSSWDEGVYVVELGHINMVCKGKHLPLSHLSLHFTLFFL
jgi:hypothetical protein